jgi:cbb3-type cytochrome oxidase maturation protein
MDPRGATKSSLERPMTGYFYLVPLALVLGAAALGAFIWALRSGQYDDLDGAAQRVLFDDDKPIID